MSTGRATNRDVEDVDFLDAEELAADGQSSYRSGDTVTSTTSSTKTVLLTTTAYILHGDAPAESGDIVILTGNAAAGTYTVDTIIDDDEFTVVESIPDSTGGLAEFRFAAGANYVGVDPTSLTQSVQTNLQGVLEDIDSAVSGGGITEAQHKTLRQLIHFINDGPAEGFASGAYKETLPTGNLFPTSEIWYTSSAKTSKIVELQTTWTGILITQEKWKIYDTDGSTVLWTITDAISYSGIVESNRTRTITAGDA